MIWKSPINISELNARMKGTLSDSLDIEFTQVTENSLIATMRVQKKHMQPLGTMHGGASCVLAETIGSTAANYCVDPKKACVGLEINVNHLRPMTEGILTAIATPYHIGKTTQVWEIKIYNEQKKLVAISRHTVAVIAKPVLLT